ncbi:MAG TPA: ROK family transcriptional regulator [Candidatus Baltobacteraceae bacterium]|nr:ROK family transcriptional regulator [Candidatus Baltobacteraceae bacterium]
MNLNQRGRLSLAADQPVMMRRRNISAIMRAILANGPLSRSEIAERTGLSPGGVTKLTSTLLAAGLLREVQPQLAPAGALGRPRVPVEIDNRANVVTALHIGTQWTTVGLVDLAGRLIYQELFPRGDTRPERVVADAARSVELTLRARLPKSRVIGLGAAIGGWIDTGAGTVVEHAALGWRGVPLREMLQEKFAYPVRLDSTVRAMALAEGWFGTAADCHNWVQLFVANVVGAAISVDGAIQRGPESAAGDLTHLPIRGASGLTTCTCGHRNCFQVVGSDQAVITAARTKRIVPKASALKDVIDAAREGDARARKLLRDRARIVGQALAVIFELINPEVAVLAGGIIHAPEYLDDLRASVARNVHRTIDLEHRILPSVLGEDAYPISPAALVLAEYYRDPMAFEPLMSLGLSS